MGRRTPGDGSIYYEAGKRQYVGAVSLGRDPQTGKRIRRKVSAPTREECRDKLDELREEKRKTGTVARRDVTVRQVVDDWLASPPPEVRSQITRECHRHAARRLPGSLLRTPLVRLTPGQVEDALAGLVRQGYATATVRMSRSVLVRAIRRAQRDGLVARNVAELVQCPHGTVRESRSMTVAQAGALLSASSSISPWLRAYVYTGIMCGLRPGELLGLRWEDVDMAAGVIRVRKSVKLVTPPGGTKRPSVENLKTDRSKRTLVMPAAGTRPRPGCGPAASSPITAWYSPAATAARAGPRSPGPGSRRCASGPASAMTGTRTSSGTRSCRCSRTPGSISTGSPTPPGTSTPT